MIVNGIVKASCVLGVVMMVSLHPATAAGATAIDTIKNLACIHVSWQELSHYSSRWGIKAQDWGDAEEAALKDKINICQPSFIPGNSKLNTLLTDRANQSYKEQLAAGYGPSSDHHGEVAQHQPSNTDIVKDEQLFVEKYCPMIVPNQKVFDSFVQPPGQVLFIDPKKMTDADRLKGAETLHMFETNTNTGMKIMSSMDVELKCKMMVGLFTSGPGFYNYYPQ